MKTLHFPRRTIYWILIATLPLTAYIGYGIVSNVVQHNFTVSSINISSKSGFPAALNAGQDYTDTLLVASNQAFTGYLDVWISNTTCSGTITCSINTDSFRVTSTNSTVYTCNWSYCTRHMPTPDGYTIEINGIGATPSTPISFQASNTLQYSVGLNQTTIRPGTTYSLRVCVWGSIDNTNCL